MELVNKNLIPFWQQYAPIKLLYGGRDSSKTKDTALYLTILACNSKVRVMCARQFQNRIEQSVYVEIKWAIERLKLEDIFTITNNTIINNQTGSEFFFYGIKRNLSDIKGTADIDILWIEEGEDLTKEQFETIEPTVRKDGSMIIILFNPKLVTDFVWAELVQSERPDILKRHINYNENPFISNKSKQRIEYLKKTDIDSYTHIYLGQPKQDDDDAIIKRRWLLACVDAHIKLDIDLTGAYRLGYDVADSGDDLNAIVLIEGAILKDVETWKAGEDELYNSTVKVYKKADMHKAMINYDTNGVGAGVGSNIKNINIQEGKNIEYFGFDNAAEPAEPNSIYKIDGFETEQTNREYFENRKAQAWWLFADRVKATYRAVELGEEIDTTQIISINSNIDLLEKLITELSTPRKVQSGRLRNMVESKKDLKKRGISSPNIADACIMAYYPYSKPQSKVTSFKVSI